MGAERSGRALEPRSGSRGTDGGAHPADSAALVSDGNIRRGGLIEVQGTAEGAEFSRAQLTQMLDLAAIGIAQLTAAQKKVVFG